MECKTCAAVMQDVDGHFWCSRCGTIGSENYGTQWPKLIDRLRLLVANLPPDGIEAFRLMGVLECIYPKGTL